MRIENLDDLKTILQGGVTLGETLLDYPDPLILHDDAEGVAREWRVHGDQLVGFMTMFNRDPDEVLALWPHITYTFAESWPGDSTVPPRDMAKEGLQAIIDHKTGEIKYYSLVPQVPESTYGPKLKEFLSSLARAITQLPKY